MTISRRNRFDDRRLFQMLVEQRKSGGGRRVFGVSEAAV
jgi:hypothetical protein